MGTNVSVDRVAAPNAVGDLVGEEPDSREGEILVLAALVVDLLTESEGAGGAGAWRPPPLGTLLEVRVTVREELGKL